MRVVLTAVRAVGAYKVFHLLTVVVSIFVGAVLYWARIPKAYTNRFQVGSPASSSSDGLREAIVALSGDPRRMIEGIALYRQRRSNLLLLSGKNTGVPIPKDAGIVVDWDSRSTLENAKNSVRALREAGIAKVILVTSDYHMFRALTIFQKFLPELKIVPHPVPSEAATISLSMSHSMRGFALVGLEFLKLFRYEILFSWRVA